MDHAMNGALGRLGLKTALLALGVWALGCSGDLGDFCQTDNDCAADLRCSAQPDQSGVCTYPAGLMAPEDAGLETVLDAPRDREEDAGTEAPMDVATPDTDPPLHSTLDGPDGVVDSAADAQNSDGVAKDTAGNQG